MYLINLVIREGIQNGEVDSCYCNEKQQQQKKCLPTCFHM